ncbi:aldose 1-epimerase family protein [Galbitalea soli]|uniref:Aldose 1-epimerase family protein n=1 Tax=Galbitalea soli TaxID=1268042 RepID=A0A7C9PPC3_9MICO|nr:aldose 1-epimerase family protein [Galbitalea soli]NEM92252.1 aldose 1-epimerase family protein [Galbitalea soli]NYJ31792.1 aldose 1-epimerase [Galbitalea soli]
MRAPTGEQYVLTRSTPLGAAEAIITEVAASIRTLRIGGIDLTQPYDEGRSPAFGCGIVLVPWPNRVRDGKWRLGGDLQQLDITEVERNNAIHGLLRNTAYRLVSRTESSVTLGAVVFPQHGYPFQLDTTVTYELVDDGLRVTHSITNESASDAPVAIGTHPFFQIGDVDTEQLTLTVHGSTRFPVDERLNVGDEIPVTGSKYDLRSGRKVSEVNLDDAFGAVVPVDQVTATLTAPDGRWVGLWQDENFPYVQVFTTRIFPRIGGGFTTGVAIEPMTAPADAFNSGQSLKWLGSGENWVASWGIRYSA